MAKAELSADNTLMWQCPACPCHHGVPISGEKAWKFNGSLELPSLQPSVRVTWHDNEANVRRECHFVLTNGVVNFCGDSWKFPGQAIPLEDCE